MSTPTEAAITVDACYGSVAFEISAVSGELVAEETASASFEVLSSSQQFNVNHLLPPTTTQAGNAGVLWHGDVRTQYLAIHGSNQFEIRGQGQIVISTGPGEIEGIGISEFTLEFTVTDTFAEFQLQETFLANGVLANAPGVSKVVAKLEKNGTEIYNVEIENDTDDERNEAEKVEALLQNLNFEPGSYRYTVRAQTDISIFSSVTGSFVSNYFVRLFAQPGADFEEEEIYWKGGNGNFEDTNHWDPMVVPDSGNVAIFDEPGPYAVSVGDQTVSKLFVRQGDVSFISGVFSALAGAPNLPSFVVGDSEVEPATLSLSTLDLITEYASIGFGPNAVGTVNIDDSVSSWNSNWITVGDSGKGTLNVSNGAPIVAQEIFIGRNQGSHGETHYSGSGMNNGGVPDIQAMSTTVGLIGKGDLYLVDAFMETGDLVVGTLLGATGTLETQSSTLKSQDVFIGLGTGSHGTLTLQGEPPETLISTATSLLVGGQSTGTFNVKDGNTFSVSENIDLGILSGGQAFVTLTGQSSSGTTSSFGTSGGKLKVGGIGSASLFVEDGGTCAASEMIIGESPEGSMGGLVGVVGKSPSGEPSRLIVLGEKFQIGGIANSPNQITGLLAIELGGEVLCANASIGGEDGVAGASVGEDSVWELSGNLVAGRADATVDPPIPLTTVKILNDGLISAQTMIFEVGTQLSGEGIYDASDFVDFGGVLNAGPEENGFKGTSPFGRLTFQGGFNMERGEIIIDVGGTSENQTDRIAIIGDMNITGGTVTFNFVDGYLPQTGEMIPFLNVSGDTVFQNIQTAYMGAAEGFEFNLVEENGMVMLEALNDAQPLGVEPTPLPTALNPDADVNRDNIIDAEDLLEVMRNWHRVVEQ